MNLDQQLDQLLTMALQEDGDRDVTTEAIVDPEATAEAVIVSRNKGIVCGLPYIEKILKAVDEEMTFEAFVDEGEIIRERMMLGALEGKLVSLLKVERILLNFLGRMSGVATMTRRFVQEVHGTNVVILDTRKTLPGWRYIDKYAVTQGGGINHRMNLTDVAMIKDNHVKAAGSITKAIEAYKAKGEEAPLIVEVDDMKQLEEVMAFSKDLARVTLDNFSVEEVKAAVEKVKDKVLLEASGGITLENVKAYADTGVHFLSVGALTHSADSFDFSFQVS